MSKIKETIEENVELLYVLGRAGIKSIAKALDYLSIYKVYESYSWLKEKTERKEIAAHHCKVSIRTVDTALALLMQEAKPKRKMQEKLHK